MTTTLTGSAEARFLSVAQAADELGVTERFIRKLITQGDLQAVKVGTRLIRIRRADLEDLLRPVLDEGRERPPSH